MGGMWIFREAEAAAVLAPRETASCCDWQQVTQLLWMTAGDSYLSLPAAHHSWRPAGQLIKGGLPVSVRQGLSSTGPAGLRHLIPASAVLRRQGVTTTPGSSTTIPQTRLLSYLQTDRKYSQLEVLVYTCYSSTWQGETGGLPGQPKLHSETQPQRKTKRLLLHIKTWI